MSRIKITTLSPIHISSGNDYEKNFNLIQKENSVYIYDEFKIVEYFLHENMTIKANINEFKKQVENNKNKILSANIQKRVIETNFLDVNKPLLEQISTNNNPIIPGSSIKGAIRTAILDCLYARADQNESNLRCEDIYKILRNKKIDINRFIDKKGHYIETFDKDFATIFKYLKFSDSFDKLKTKVYKTINIKKESDIQHYRQERTEELINFVEAIEPNQRFEIEFEDISSERYNKKIFSNIGNIANRYYIPWYQDELQYYFKAPLKATKDIFEKLKKLNNNIFLLNIGRFSGAERKSINGLRRIKNSKADDKSTTTTRTYALEKDIKNELFEKSLYPFGWLLCEIV